MLWRLARTLVIAGVLALPAAAQTPPPAGDRTMVDVSVRGMDDAIRRMGQMSPTRDTQQITLALTLLRGFAKPGAAEGGRSRHDFQIEVTADGRLLVNGIDLSLIQQALSRRP